MDEDHLSIAEALLSEARTKRCEICKAIGPPRAILQRHKTLENDMAPSMKG